MNDKICVRAELAIADKVFPGCVIGTVRQNGASTILPLGYMSYESNPSHSSAVREDTIYDLASITKSIPVASLASVLIAEGKLSLGDKVTVHLPELQNDYGATIEDLLLYRVSGPQMSSLRFKTFQEIRTAVFERGFNGPPGESTYTNLPAFLLGIILERVRGKLLPELAHKYLFEPLEMRDTSFFPAIPDASYFGGRQNMMRIDSRIAPTEIVDGQEIRGIVHDESARVFARARRAVGHAGLFSTAPDLLKFLEAMLAGKLPPVVEGAQRGLGWETNREWMGSKRRPKTFGKTGFTGTSILIDIERQIGLVILANRTYPHRPSDNSTINLFRKDIADIVFR